MKRKLTITYAVICTLLLLAGFVGVFFSAWQERTADLIKALIGLVLGVIIAPTVHELGHVVLAKTQNMRIEYVKFFCVKLTRKEGELRFSFASPFTADQTQVMPKSGKNMQKRAGGYVLGGLFFSGALLVLISALSLVCTLFFKTDYLFLGMLPYLLYLFMLNVVPMEYASGKTDMLVYKGLQKGYDAEKVMLSAMEIQGKLFNGESFAEMDEKLFYDLPVLCEDEPLFLVITDLRYRYHLECGELEQAGKELNRLASLEEYMTFEEKQKTAVELTYMHALTGDRENALKNAEFCKELLAEERVESKRALIACALAVGKNEEAKTLVLQAEQLLEKEENAGLKKFESVLLTRMKNE